LTFVSSFFLCLLQLIHERIKCAFDLISEDIYIYIYVQQVEWIYKRTICLLGDCGAHKGQMYNGEKENERNKWSNEHGFIIK